jgi:hypothetical protein
VAEVAAGRSEIRAMPDPPDAAALAALLEQAF